MLTTEEYQFDPEKWGWRLDGTKLNPIMTDLPAAPEALLKFVRCKCKLTSRNKCMLLPQNGGDCRGLNCLNADDIIELEEENLELEDDNTIL